MKALKQATFTLIILAGSVLVGIAGFNTAQTQMVQVSKNDFNIKFAKRLDEIKGEVVIGRLAASVPKFEKKSVNVIKKQVNNILNPPVKAKIEKLLPEKKEENAQRNVPAPVVSDDLDLSLSGGLFNKKPLDGDSEFSGSAKVVDGVIEEITVNLPDGDGLVINTSERMVGNVFQYEDTQTRELKSGLFYKVKPGVFMVTLTNDSQYPGLRLEFKTDEVNADIAQDDIDKNWSMDGQNDEQSDYYSENDVDSEDNYDEELEEEAQESQESFGFNFAS